MGIVNRRNAVAGWAVWKLGKRILRRKARQKVAPVAQKVAPVAQAARRPKALVAFFVAAAAGVATFLRSRGSGKPEA